MKPVLLSAACVLLFTVCGVASASGPCYTVYGKKDVIVYRSTESPIDLSRSIRSGIDKRFPGGHLVMQSGVIDCPSVLPVGTQAHDSGASPDDSPALRLKSPYSEVQARADHVPRPAPRRKSSRTQRNTRTAATQAALNVL